jgi:hypothetical protein
MAMRGWEGAVGNKPWKRSVCTKFAHLQLIVSMEMKSEEIREFTTPYGQLSSTYNQKTDM